MTTPYYLTVKTENSIIPLLSKSIPKTVISPRQRDFFVSKISLFMPIRFFSTKLNNIFNDRQCD